MTDMLRQSDGSALGSFEGLIGLVHRHRGLLLPIGAAALIFAVLVPLPAMLMDVLLAANLALAAMVLLTTINVGSPIEFSVFPSLLLGTTLIRLVLNVASTRLILTAGADGRTMAEAQFAAGRVIWAFGNFVTAGSLEVGVILFAIIAVIQFVVITKGAARISEVAARFVLDSMPGKQMAIDADVNAGLIDEAEAHERRALVTRESDFYGSMDGASKFLRGDAVAAVLITLVNVLGGLYMGMVQYGWGFGQTFELFTRLTIGDGLVTQIPAFIVSISAALLVTRSTARTNLGEEVISQLTSRPVALVITAVFLVALTFTSLPKGPLLMLSFGCVGLAWVQSRRRRQASDAAPTPGESGTVSTTHDIRPMLSVDPLRMELGFGLVALTQNEDADLLARVKTLREEIAAELGLVVPQVRIVDNITLPRNQYAVKIRGARVACGELHPRKCLAIGDTEVSGEIAGVEATDPATGDSAVWISVSQQAQAEMLNYRVIAPAGVLVRHLGAVIRNHAAELLSRQQVSMLLENLRNDSPDLVTDVLEAAGIGRVQKVLQNLLREAVPIRDLETILETICDAAPRIKDADELTEQVRLSLGRMLAQHYCNDEGTLWYVSLEPSLANEIAEKFTGKGPTAVAGQSAAGKHIAEALADGVARLTRHGRKPVVICDAAVRRSLRKIIAPVLPAAAVLAYSEVDTVEIQSVGSVGLE